MSGTPRQAFWEARFAATPDYVFGTEPNAFLAAQAHRIAPGARVLSVADGEGRNGVYLAGRGADVLAVEISPAAIAKARRLAAERGVSLAWEQADVMAWDGPDQKFDVVVAIFVQFITAAERPEFFSRLKRALKPGGTLLLEGYRPEQIGYGTGGPQEPSQLYTEEMLREAFADMEIVALNAYDTVVDEGRGHSGLSALIDLIAIRRLEMP